MSWDAALMYEGDAIFEQNYTSNINPMLQEALRLPGSWYEYLNGLSGHAGDGFLKDLIVRLRADPLRYRAMNPSNNWGSYDRVIPVLEGMREVSSKHPGAVWEIMG